MNIINIKINNKLLKISNDKKITFIAGPCVLETETQSLKIAKVCKEICEKYDVNYIFKASFDKANRTNLDSFRGIGREKGIDILLKIREKFFIPITTDIHSIYDIKFLKNIVDIIQIPAFLCRQTDLIVEAAKTGKIVNVKKGQFLAPSDMINIIKKIEAQNNRNIILTERGTSFGYNNLVVDMKGIAKMKKFLYPVFFDATHSMQLPGGCKTFSGGEREFTLDLAKAASSIGIAGIFMEVHPNPEKSLSDSQTIYDLNKFEDFIKKITKIDELVKNFDKN